jgi:hypothetical protein
MRKVSMVVDLSTKVVLLHKNKGCVEELAHLSTYIAASSQAASTLLQINRIPIARKRDF